MFDEVLSDGEVKSDDDSETHDMEMMEDGTDIISSHDTDSEQELNMEDEEEEMIVDMDQRRVGQENQQPNDITDIAFTNDFAFKIIPEFDGNRENLHAFLSCCDVVWEVATTRAQQVMFMHIAKSILSGSTYKVIRYGEMDDWPVFKSILQNQNLERRIIAQIQTELLSARRYHNEDVRAFANRIEILTIDLNDACVANEGQNARVVIENSNNKSSSKASFEGPFQLVEKASSFDDFANAVEAAFEKGRNF
ncbi:hypothetical protein JTB14_013908 [Gonioctena quinquepunctata]|nr:hypothetical protein JTB14_013908 [Gonioctena quinquepunctata]